MVTKIKVITLVCFQLCVTISQARRIDSSQEPEIHPSIEPSLGQNDIRSTSRNPRFFLGTTTTSTTVLSTTTACYTSAAAITTACSKKRRSIEDLPIVGISVSDSSQILPSSSNKRTVVSQREDKSLNPREIKDLNQIANVRVGTRGQSRVEPRFLLYFYTSTVTTTSTSFTATTTFTITNCTPAGSFAYTVCG